MNDDASVIMVEWTAALVAVAILIAGLSLVGWAI